MLLKDDVNADTEYRNKAVKIAKALMNEIKKNGFDNFEKRYSNKGNIYRITTLDLGFTADEYLNFKFHEYEYTNHDMDGKVNAGIDTHNTIHVFYDPENNIDIKQNTQLEKTIMHEIIHALDNIRTDFNMNSSTDGTYDEYVNSPSELNAHYQEMIYDVEEFLSMLDKHSNKDKVRDLLMSTPEKFITFALGRLDTVYRKALSPTSLKKYKKRLYQYYNENLKSQ